MIDSHCHLNLLNKDAFDGSLEKVMAHAREMGVEHILCPGVTFEDLGDIIQIVDKYDWVSVSVGKHPGDDEGVIEPTVEMLADAAAKPCVVALGETGLDYVHYRDEPSVQKIRFANHIKAAIKIKKPLIIHNREATADVLDILTGENAKEVGGVFHCFSGDVADAKKILDMGFYLGFSGVVTFKNAKNIQEVAKYAPLDKILVETDAPWLTPVPYRGKPNYPGYVKYISEFIATLRGIYFKKMEQASSDNFRRLFML